MKPAAFLYRRAGTLDEALGLLAEHGEEARPLAGGQSLTPMMNVRLAQPSALVDLNPVAELAYVRASDGHLEVGAMTRQRELEQPDVAAACPLLAAATRFIGHFQIRNRGTIGGSLAHADPAAEYPAVATALDAELVLQGPRGRRALRAREFFLGPFMTALEPGELLVEARLPTWGTAAAFEELARREGDFALAGVAVALDLDGRRIRRAGVALLGVGPLPIPATAAEELLVGAEPGDSEISAAADAAAAQAEPRADIHADADYRRELVRVLMRRALSAASRGA
jgi:carbon-monoxide dehydrogenase medium subunit